MGLGASRLHNPEEIIGRGLRRRRTGGRLVPGVACGCGGHAEVATRRVRDITEIEVIAETRHVIEVARCARAHGRPCRVHPHVGKAGPERV